MNTALLHQVPKPDHEDRGCFEGEVSAMYKYMN